MTKDEHIAYWLESSQHDLESSESIFNTGRYDWCLFVGHLSLEKILKARYVNFKNNELPPKIHNLVRLAELADIALNDDQKLLLDTINDFNIQTRYPDYKLDFYKRCTREYAYEYLNKIKEMHKWLNSLLK